MTKSYYTVDGQMLGEKTTGNSRIDYLPDALGSVTATVDQTAATQNTYRYKPYGTQLAKTGTATDPKFLWNGLHGGRATGAPYAEVYSTRLSYSSKIGQWVAASRRLADAASEYSFSWPTTRRLAGSPAGGRTSGPLDIMDTSPLDIMPNSPCGTGIVSFRATWEVPLTETYKFGVILQRITISNAAWHCGGGEIGSNDITYVEAWYVSQWIVRYNPNDPQSREGIDNFGFDPICPDGGIPPKSCGHANWDAKIGFYPMDSDKQARDFILGALNAPPGDPCASPAGKLYWKKLTGPGDRSFPFPDKSPPTQSHSMHYKWNCCAGTNWFDGELVAPARKLVPNKPDTQERRLPQPPTKEPPCPGSQC